MSPPEEWNSRRRAASLRGMSTTPHTRSSAPSTRPAATALGGALAFVACYLAVDLVAGRVATARRARAGTGEP